MIQTGQEIWPVCLGVPMDDYALIQDFLLNLAAIQSWPAMGSVIKRATTKRDRNWQLPLLACEAVGGSLELALPAMAAVACEQISIILIDDLLDADPRGEYHRLGAPTTANLAVAFQAAGLEAIRSSQASWLARLSAAECLNQMTLTTALGQYHDTQNPATEAEYWMMVKMKSAPFFGAALYVGALLGEADETTATAIQHFGHLYGEMIQIHDDLQDTMAIPAGPDWLLGRSTLPILFAQLTDHPEREKFFKLRGAVSDPDILTEAQRILVRCGAISYGVYHLRYRYQQGQALLKQLALTHRAKLETLLEAQIQPVRDLFKALDLTFNSHLALQLADIT